MKKIVFGVILLIVLFIGAAVAYVMNADWIGQHRDKIAEQFYKSTGKVVQFDGNMSFNFLPVPHMRAYDVKVFNDEKRDYMLAEMRSMDAEVALKPLLRGEFDVTKMELNGVKFNIDWDNGFSWQGDLSTDQRQMVEEARLELNSVMVKDAQVSFKSQANNIDFELTNLNGEISAEGMLGPFRMEGNYINGSSPEGFALTMGRLSETAPTTLNLAVTHPNSNSYIRFDGSFQSSNKVINGNVIIESENIAKFTKANFKSLQIPDDYNQKTQLGFDIALSPQAASLSNVVVKYGENTQGSGNLFVPLHDDENQKIRLSFNFTDLDLSGFEVLAEDFIRDYQNKHELPQWTVEGKIASQRVHYLDQQLKDFNIDFDYDEQVLNLKSAEAVLPGNTKLILGGEFFSIDDLLHYKLEVRAGTENLMQTLKWLKLEPKQASPSVYKNMALNAKVSGNFERAQISPFKLILDKSTIDGEAGIIWKDKTDIMLVAQADTINFDNYVTPLPDEEKQKSWPERLGARFARLGVLNDIDLVLDAKADLVIYESMPFEKVAIKGNVLNKTAEIEYINIDKVANTKVGLSGKLSGFGGRPQADGLNFDIKSSDVSSLISKLELSAPSLDYKKFSNLSLNGTINGTINQFGINARAGLGNLAAEYVGKVEVDEGKIKAEGDLELKHPAFAQLLANLQLPYEPAGDNLGLLQLKTTVKGAAGNWEFTKLEADIGSANMTGYLNYEETNGRNSIMTQLKINRLDVMKFLPKSAGSRLPAVVSTGETAFIKAPDMSKDKIDYTPYKSADVRADITADELIIGDELIRDAKFNLEVINSQATIRSLEGMYNSTPLKTDAVITMENTPQIVWSGTLSDANVNNFNLSGKVYGLREGTFNLAWNLQSSAESKYDFWANLQGNIDFKAAAVMVKGFDAKSVYDDLLQRETNEGLSEKVRQALIVGTTAFKNWSVRLNINSGQFTLADAKGEADNLNVNIYGDGNLPEWKMNAVFNAKFGEPQYLPEFSFILKEDIANPTVDVNVSSLFKFYKAKIDQKEAEAEQIVENEKKQRGDVLFEQQRLADDLVADARGDLEKDIDAKMEIAYSKKSKDKYASLKQDINQVLGGLIEQMASFDKDNLQDADLLKMDEINKQARREIKRLNDRKADIYLEDEKLRLDGRKNNVIEEYNAIKQQSFAYNGLVEKYRERLTDITTDYNLDEDITLQRQKDIIEKNINDLEAMYAKAVKIYDDDKLQTIGDYEKANVDLAELVGKMSAGREALQEMLDKMDERETSKIDEVIATYRVEVEEKENQRLLKENTGSIKVKKTGQTFKVSRDLDEIKNANEAVSSEGIRVLDFTKQKAQIYTPEAPKVGVVKKGGKLIAN